MTKFSLFLLLTIVFFQMNSQEVTKQLVIMKVIETTYEGASAKAESKIVIVKPDGNTETVLLKRASMLIDADENFFENQKKIRSTLQIWVNNGYRIESMSTASPQTYLLVSTIILTKE